MHCLDFWVGDMNELLAQLFGQQPGYATALFGEDEAARLRQQAQQQGLMNVGLSLLAGSGPSPQRRGIGQLLAQGVMAGQQAYQGAYNRALQEQMLKEQIQERQQLRQEQMAAQQLLPQIIRPGGPVVNYYGKQTGFALRDDEGNIMPGAEMGVSAPQLDMNVLTRLLTTAPSVARNVLPTVEAFRKMTAPERMTLKEGEQVFEMTPEGPRVVAGAPKPREPKFTTVDVGNAIIEYRDGVEVRRIPKGRAPEGPVSLQTVETEAGLMTFNPRTGQYTPVMQDGKPIAGKSAKPTEGERNAAGFAGRMIEASNILNSPAISAAAPSFGSSLAAAVPFVGETLKNVVQSPETQQYEQAASDWVRAKLRRESGAAIGDEEALREFRTYFPVPGDSPQVIRQKTQARNLATQGMIQSAGVAKIPTPPAPQTQPVDLQTAAQQELERRRRGQ